MYQPVDSKNFRYQEYPLPADYHDRGYEDMEFVQPDPIGGENFPTWEGEPSAPAGVNPWEMLKIVTILAGSMLSTNLMAKAGEMYIKEQFYNGATLTWKQYMIWAIIIVAILTISIHMFGNVKSPFLTPGNA